MNPTSEIKTKKEIAHCSCGAPLYLGIRHGSGMTTCHCGVKNLYNVAGEVFQRMEPTGKPCQCTFHRYDVVHVYRYRIYDHSQATWDEKLRFVDSGELETYPARFYQHGMTADELRLVASVESGVIAGDEHDG